MTTLPNPFLEVNPPAPKAPRKPRKEKICAPYIKRS